MYICSVCQREFDTKEQVKRHYLRCWYEQHPYHQSKPAPRSEDIVTREINDDVTNFFSSFGGGSND